MTTKKKNLPTQADDASAVVNQEQEKSEDVVTLEPEVTRAIRVEIRRAIVSESYSGPMPKPDHMEKYDRIVPGAAKDILEEFKANGLHARKTETMAIQGAINNDKRGQWMAFGLLILGFVLIAYLANIGQSVVAGVVAGTLLVAVIAGFLTKKPFSKENLAELDKDLESIDTE